MIDPTGSSLGNSLDIQQDLRNQLKAILPQAFSDNNLDFEKLKQLLGDDFTSPREERYGISWAGKTEAFRELQQTTTSTLNPDSTSVGSESDCRSSRTHEGIFIEGENLEVLKVLQKSYYGKVKMIYIDPPYNTGNDSFVYPDDFSETKAAYQEKGNINLNRLNLWQKNSKDSGKYHSSWLSMMYPRLFMARNLLREDGVIFISIDDNEQANLKLLMDEIFGEENFAGTFPWKKRTAKSDVPFGVSQDYEWILCYTKGIFGAGIQHERKYYQTDDYSNDRWRLSDLTTQRTPEERPNSNFTMIDPKTGKAYPVNPQRVWGITKDSFKEYYNKGKVVFPDDYDFLNIKIPSYRVFESEDKEKALKKFGSENSMKAVSTMLPKEVGMSEDGNKEMVDLFGYKSFSFPKPTNLIKHLVNAINDKNALILDFFAGSGTTAQAVMELNAEDGGNRQFICVQMPEPTDPNSEAYKAGYQTIADITRARIQKVQEKLSLKNKVQYYKLQPSNFKIWQSDIDTEEELLAQLELYAQPHTTPETPEENLLTELMLKAGFMLTANVQTISTADGIKLYDIENGTMTVALSALSEKVILTICERKPKEFICLDNLFESDVQKSNWSLQLAEAGVNLQVI